MADIYLWGKINTISGLVYEISIIVKLPVFIVRIRVRFAFMVPYTDDQCCESGSGIQCIFDPWIRDLDIGYQVAQDLGYKKSRVIFPR